MAEVTRQTLERSLVFKRARVSGLPPAGPTFRELLTEALVTLPEPNERSWSRGTAANADSIMTVLNFEQREASSVFAEMLKTFPGQPTFAAEPDPARNRYRLLECQPPTDTSEFVRGVLLFYVYGDGVVIMPTNTFKVSELDDYLTWLLQQAKLITAADSVVLFDEPLGVVEQNIEHLSGARSVRLSASIADILNFREPETDDKKSGFATLLKPVMQMFESAANAIRPGLPPIAATEKLHNDLDVTIEIRLPKGQRSTFDVLDALAVASREFRGFRWSASLESGFRLGSGKSAVSRQRGILHENRYPSFVDARKKMAETMEELMTSGLIGHLGVYEEE